MYFAYGQKELEYLKNKDKLLADAIDKIGHIERTVNPDLFSSLIHHVVGQQISIAAQKTIWKRMTDSFGKVTAEAVAACSIDELQKFGISFKKAEYMSVAANKVHSGELVLETLHEMDDAKIIEVLSALPGIGIWTAEMIMIFSMQRPNIFSYGDLAIHRGLRMLYHHRRVDKKLFEKYRRRYTPYCSVASLYLWAIACGAIEGMRDYAPKKKPTPKRTSKAKTDNRS